LNPKLFPKPGKSKSVCNSLTKPGDRGSSNNNKKGTIRGDRTESMSSFMVVDQPHYTTAIAAAAAEDIDMIMTRKLSTTLVSLSKASKKN